MSKFDGTNWTNFSNNAISYGVRIIAIDKQGNKWFVNSGYDEGNSYEDSQLVGYGVTKFDGTNWTNYTSSNSGLSNIIVQAIYVDNHGNIWFGTHTGISELKYSY